MILKYFSSICDLGVSIADFGTRGPVFKSGLNLFFFVVKIEVLLGIEPGAFKSKVSYAYHRVYNLDLTLEIFNT